MPVQFPPPLTVGNRVWTTHGYRHHGPFEGAKVDIAPKMGGVITTMERPVPMVDSMLYTVEWDNGQTSKHDANGLFCIGRFQTRAEFEAAIKFAGPVELTLGSKGEFHHVKIALEYDGQPQEVELSDRGLWLDCLGPLAKEQDATVNATKLPPKTRKKGTS